MLPRVPFLLLKLILIFIYNALILPIDAFVEWF